jgi:hypothetical protein
LFIDVRGKDNIEYIKECVIDKEKLPFDGVYSWNNDIACWD